MPVRTVSRLIGDWVHRLGTVWVEGQVTQINHRSGSPVVFLTLRDPAADVSITVRCAADLLARVRPVVAAGSRVVVLGRPEFYLNRGTLSLAATEVCATSASANSWPGSNGSSRCSRRRGCSPLTANGRSRSCQPWSD